MVSLSYPIAEDFCHGISLNLILAASWEFFRQLYRHLPPQGSIFPEATRGGVGSLGPPLEKPLHNRPASLGVNMHGVNHWVWGLEA